MDLSDQLREAARLILRNEPVVLVATPRRTLVLSRAEYEMAETFCDLSACRVEVVDCTGFEEDVRPVEILHLVLREVLER